MFGKIVEGWKARKEVKELEKHPVFGNVLIVLRQILNDKTKGLGQNWSEDGKFKLIDECLQDINQQLMQPNPVQAIRMRAIDFQLVASTFDVLIMQPPTPCKELSGDLKQHIPELAKCNKELLEFFYGLDDTPTTFDEMWNAVLGRYWVMHLYMSGYNAARIALGDFYKNDKKDWFGAAYRSFCINKEWTYRKELGLPSNIDGDNSALKSIMHTTWINRAEEGHEDLRRIWETSWEDAFHEQSPYTGVEI